MAEALLVRSCGSRIQRYAGLLLLVISGTLEARGYGVVQAPELARWLGTAEDRLLVVDVRERAAYRTGTIPGALYAGSDPAGFLPDGRGGAVVLLISHPPDSQRLGDWVRRFGNAGHRVHVLEGGLPAWGRAGYTVETPQEYLARPGNVPFVIPRGICENKPPIQAFR